MAPDEARVDHARRDISVLQDARPMRFGDANQRRIEGAETRPVALAPVHIADERLVWVAPPHSALPIYIHRTSVSAELRKDLVLAAVNPLVCHAHRPRSLFASHPVLFIH